MLKIMSSFRSIVLNDGVPMQGQSLCNADLGPLCIDSQ